MAIEGVVTRKERDEFIDSIADAISKEIKNLDNINCISDKITEFVKDEYINASKYQVADNLVFVLEIASSTTSEVDFDSWGVRLPSKKTVQPPKPFTDGPFGTNKSLKDIEKIVFNKLKHYKPIDDIKISRFDGIEIKLRWDLAEIKQQIARIGVSYLAQNGVKAKAVPDSKGVKFIVERDTDTGGFENI